VFALERRTSETVLSESFSASSSSGTTTNNQCSALVTSIALDHLLGALGGLDFIGITRHNNIITNDFDLRNKICYEFKSNFLGY